MKGKGPGMAPRGGPCVPVTLVSRLCRQEGVDTGNSLEVMEWHLLVAWPLPCPAAPPGRYTAFTLHTGGPLEGLQPGPQGQSHEPMCQALGLGHTQPALLSSPTFKEYTFRMWEEASAGQGRAKLETRSGLSKVKGESRARIRNQTGPGANLG